jgi:hypothetical protein
MLEAQHRNQAEELANHTKSVDKAQQQQGKYQVWWSLRRSSGWVQVDIFILYVGNQKNNDASSASGYITGIHFSKTLC